MNRSLFSNSYVQSKNKNQFVWFSNPSSAQNRTISILSVVETLIAISFSIWIGYKYNFWLHLAVSVTAAPILLLRSDESIKLGINCLRWFDKDKYSYNSRGGRYLSGVLLAIWAFIMLLFVRIYATIWSFFRNGFKTIINIPRNWRLFSLCIDVVHPPEAIAGIETYVKNYPNDRQLSELTVRSLFKRYRDRNKNRSFGIKVLRTLIYSWVFSCLFIPSFFFRWSLKSSSIVYLPFIYLSKDVSFSEISPIERSQKVIDSKAGLIWAIFGVWLILTIIPILLASFIKTLIETYNVSSMLYDVINFFTFTPCIEKWNLIRLLCATLTIIMYFVAKFNYSKLKKANIQACESGANFWDNFIKLLYFLRSAGMCYVMLCAIILLWDIAININFFDKLFIVMPEIGESWFPRLHNSN